MLLLTKEANGKFATCKAGAKRGSVSSTKLGAVVPPFARPEVKPMGWNKGVQEKVSRDDFT